MNSMHVSNFDRRPYGTTALATLSIIAAVASVQLSLLVAAALAGIGVALGLSGWALHRGYIPAPLPVRMGDEPIMTQPRSTASGIPAEALLPSLVGVLAGLAISTFGLPWAPVLGLVAGLFNGWRITHLREA